MLILYWFIPFKTTEFGMKSSNFNFSLDSKIEDMQFFPNMRFPDSQISYQIYDCPLQKRDDMNRAFEIISNKTVLEFYPASYNPEISVTCDSRNKIEGGLDSTFSGSFSTLKGTVFLEVISEDFGLSGV